MLTERNVRVAIMLVALSGVTAGCVTSSGANTASPLPQDARIVADRFLAALLPRGDTQRARRFASESLAEDIPELLKTFKRTGVRVPTRGVLSRQCGTAVAKVPVPGGRDCVVYTLFGKTREPRMVVENRGKLRMWMVKTRGGWRVDTYDYHVRVRILPR